MNKNSIMYVSGAIPPDITGSGIRALYQAEYLAKKSNIFILTNTKKKNNTDVECKRLINLNIDIRNPIFKFWNLFASIMLAPFHIIHIIILIYKNNVKIIHLFGFGMISTKTIIALRFTFNRNTNVIFEVTNDFIDSPNSIKKRLKGLYRFLFSSINGVIVQTNQSYMQWNSESASNFKVRQVFHPIDLLKFSPIEQQQKKETIESLGISDKFIVNYTGMIKGRKGIPEIIDTAEILVNEFGIDDILFLIVGKFQPKPYKDTIFELLKQKYLKSYFLFIDFNDRPERYMQISDLTIFMSKAEGLPKSPMESIACGVPVIMKNIEGTSNLIINDGNGQIINNSEEAAWFIKNYYDNKNDLEKASIKARMYAKKHFDLVKNMNRILAFYHGFDK